MILTFLKAYGVQLGIAALILFALWKVDANGFNRAKRDAEVAEVARKEMERRLNTKIEVAIRDGIVELDRSVGERVGEIDDQERTGATIIHREILRDPSLSDPKRGLGVELFNALNRAACASHPATAECHR